MLKNKLEIILITYNRKPFLKRTLEQVFSENSPVKDFKITILDNHSDDGTSELIEEYREKFPNIRHVIHNRNIGGNANIARAFEIAESEYVWVICDDDYYDWNNWHYVEDAVNEGHDCILTTFSQIKNQKNISDIIFQLTFLPSGIYRTSILDTDVMRNIYDNIQNYFPHLMPAIKIANTSKDFFIIKEPVVINGPEKDSAFGGEVADMSGTRGNNKKNLLPVSQNMHFFIGYINSLTLLKDPNGIMKGLKSAAGYRYFEQSMTSVFARVVKNSAKNKKSSNLYYDFACRMDLPSKIILTFFKYCPLYFFVNPKGIFVQILNRATIRIIPFKW